MCVACTVIARELRKPVFLLIILVSVLFTSLRNLLRGGSTKFLKYVVIPSDLHIMALVFIKSRHTHVGWKHLISQVELTVFISSNWGNSIALENIYGFNKL